jgi:hypothetical protein
VTKRVNHGTAFETRIDPRYIYICILFSSYLTERVVSYFTSIRKISLLMLFREKIAVYCKNHAKHTNTLREKNEVFSVKRC